MDTPSIKLEEAARLVKIAREIAMDMVPIDKILETYKISEQEWDVLSNNPYFSKLVQSEAEAWQGALKTQERVQVKAGYIIEEWLPEAWARLHDQKENLAAKTELAKLISRLADVGTQNAAVNGGGERFSLTINVGDGKPIRVERDITPQPQALPTG